MNDEPALRPFPGLRAFDIGDSKIFFGRDEHIAALYRLLDRHQFIAVVGSSGSGKSSLVRAGLLPLLEQESAESGGRQWRFATLNPGFEPIDNLANAVASVISTVTGDSDADRRTRRERVGFSLRRSSFGLADAVDEVEELSDKRIVLVVDQFEEIFRYATARTGDATKDAASRDGARDFVRLLIQGSRRSPRLQVLITMRSDFIGDCSRFYDLPEAVSAAQFLVPSLTRDQREEAIRAPIALAEGAIESELVERLLNDANDEADQLPVLQHCLSRLWECAPDHKLAVPEYFSPRIGTLRNALSIHADEVMNSPELHGLENAVESVFRALTWWDEEGRATRRVVEYAQLVDECGLPEDQIRKVVDRFRKDDCSFIVTSPPNVASVSASTRIDVVHEALLRRWDKISARDEDVTGEKKGWLAAEEADARYYQALLALLEQPGARLPEEQLEERSGWWETRTKAWTRRYAAGYDRSGDGYERVTNLFEKSRAAVLHDRQTARQARTAKRNARYAAAGIALALIALLGGTALGIQTIRANHQTELATNLNSELTKSQENLKTQNRKLNDTLWLQKQQQVKLAKLNDNLSAKTKELQANQKALELANSKLAAADQVHVGLMMQAQTARDQVNVAREQTFLDAGQRALMNDQDADHAALYLAAAYKIAPNDPRVAALLPQALAFAEVPKREIRVTSAQGSSAISAIAFDPHQGAREFVTAETDGTVGMWDERSGQALARSSYLRLREDPATALAFSPKGSDFITGAEDGTLVQWHRKNSRLTQRSFTGQAGRINAVAYNPSGAAFASASNDGTVVVRFADGSSSTWALSEHAHPADVAFDSKGTSLISAAADGKLREWNWQTGQETILGRTVQDQPLLHLAAPHRGSYIAAGSADGQLLVLDERSGKVTNLSLSSEGALDALAIDPSGRWIVAGGSHGTAKIVDATTSTVSDSLPSQNGAPAMLNARFSGTGSTLATTYGDGSTALWAFSEGHVTRIASHVASSGASRSLIAFSPDDTMVATAGADGTVEMWPTQRVTGEMFDEHSVHLGAIQSLSFDPTGNHVITGSRGGTAMMWTVASDRLVHPTPLVKGSNWIGSIKFDARGDRLLVTEGGTIDLFGIHAENTTKLQTIHTTVAQKFFSDAALSDDGNLLAAVQTQPYWGTSSAAITPPAHACANTSREPISTYQCNRWFTWAVGKSTPSMHEPADSWWTTPRLIDISNSNKYVMLHASISSNQQGGYMAVFRLSDGVEAAPLTVATAASAHHSDRWASGADNGTVSVWTVSSQNKRLDLKRLNRWARTTAGGVTALAFSPDDRFIAASGHDNAITILDVNACANVGVVTSSDQSCSSSVHAIGHREMIRSLQFSRDNKYVISVADDGTAKLWDRSSGALLGTAAIPGASITSAVFNPNGGSIALGASNGDALLWRLQPGANPETIAENILRRDPVNDTCLARQARDVLRGRQGLQSCE